MLETKRVLLGLGQKATGKRWQERKTILGPREFEKRKSPRVECTNFFTKGKPQGGEAISRNDHNARRGEARVVAGNSKRNHHGNG